jgi:hypothetical protein
MKRTAYLAVAAIVVFVPSLVRVSAQKTSAVETFTGVVSAMSGSSLTVERASITGIFTVDPKTMINVRGATAKTKASKEAGKPGLTLADAVHVGDQVTVKYHQDGKTMIANNILVRESLGKK